MIHVVVPSRNSAVQAQTKTTTQNGSISATKPTEAVRIPVVNVKTEDAGWRLEVAAPGLNKSDFKLHIEGSTLTVEATYAAAAPEEGVKIVRREFGTGLLRRSFQLPDNTDVVGIQASYEAGILAITLPKKAVVRVEIG